ncbi:MAG: prolipoprotein diacylglyceryl transferase [Ignavibacteria bacterium]|nr:prolipoprotein diacylglyceryl transferase [Ignavibacteria bacterium]
MQKKAMLLTVVWDVSPDIFHFPDWLPLIGGNGVRWYGLLFAASFVVGYWIMLKIFKRENLKIEMLDELSTYMLLATVIGARLGHCLFYEPEYYLANPIEILKVWEGGLASHGAAVGIVFALFFFARKYKTTVIWTLDRVVVVVALAGFFIRTGNLMNSEIFGHITSLPWAFQFVRASEVALRADPRHPTQIYEGLFYLGTFFFLYRSYFKFDKGKQTGFIFGWFLMLIFGSRFFIEFLKEPQVGFEQGMALNMGQWLSIPWVIAGFIIWYLGYKKTKTA